MTYDPTVPQAAQFISTSQPIIQGNFDKLNVDFSVDHFPNTTPVAPGSQNGQHQKITYGILGVPPYPITSLQSYAYSKLIDPGTPGTLTSLEYQSSGTDVISGVAPICPITPRCLLSFTSAGSVINRSFNVLSAVAVGNQLTVTFQEPAPDTNYLIFFTVQLSFFAIAASVFSRSLTNFVIVAGAGFDKADIMVF